MRLLVPILLLAACGSGSRGGAGQPLEPGGECRAADDPGVHAWLDLETCKAALVPPCPEGQTFTTDACGCYCLEDGR